MALKAFLSILLLRMKKEDLKELEKLLKNRDPKQDGIDYHLEWIEKNNQLFDYTYIHTNEEFKNLKKGGVIKPIRLENYKLMKGGIIIDIKQNKYNHWYALVGLPKMGKVWKIYLNQNYIFYREPYSIYKNNEKTDRFKDILSKFVTPDEKVKYDSLYPVNDKLEKLFKTYKKN